MLFYVSSASAVAATNALSATVPSNNSSLKDFVSFFGSTFIAPIFQILRDTVILGYPLLNWVFGLTIIALAVKFFRAFLPTDNNEK